MADAAGDASCRGGETSFGDYDPDSIVLAKGREFTACVATARFHPPVGGRPPHTFHGRSLSATPSSSTAASAPSTAISEPPPIGISVGGSYGIRVFDLSQNVLLRNFAVCSSTVWGCDISPDGRLAVVGTQSNALMMFDTITGERLATLHGHDGPIRCCQFFEEPDGSGRIAGIVSGAWERCARVWDISEVLELVEARTRQRDDASGDLFTVWEQPTTEVAVAGGEVTINGARLQLPHTDTCNFLRTFTFAMGRTDDASIATLCLSGSEDGYLRVFDLANGTELATLLAHDRGKVCRGVAVASESWPPASSAMIISVATDDEDIRIWTLEVNDSSSELGTESKLKFKKRSSVRMSEKGALSVDISDDLRHAVVGTVGGSVVIVNCDENRIEDVFSGLQDLVRGCAISADGSRILAGGTDNMVRSFAMPGAMRLVKSARKR